MKKQYLLYLLLSLPLVGLTSCLFDQEDLFDENASERIEAWKMEVKSVLESAENGWHCRYFPDEDQAYGGYNLFFKFDGSTGEVTMASEIEDASYTETSLFSYGEDQSVTVCFDTKNTIMDYFCHPVNSDLGLTYKGMNGDFQFEVVSATPEEVVMRGLITTNTYIMDPIPAGVTWEEEMKEYKAAANDYIFDSYSVVVNGVSYAASRSNNSLNVELGNDSYMSLPYIYTKTGISLYQPYTIDGVTAQDLDINDPEIGYYFQANEGQSFIITAPEPIQSDNTFTISITDIQPGRATINVTPSNSDYYYISWMSKTEFDSYRSNKAIIAVMTAELNEDISATDDVEAIMQERSYTGSNSRNAIKLAVYGEDYVALVVGVGVSTDGTVIMSSTALSTYEFSVDHTGYPSDTEDDYLAWIGDWTIVSESSETSFSSYTFYVTVYPDEINESFWITGWGYCQIADEAVINAVYNARSTAGALGIAGNQYMDIWYSAVREYYLRTRLVSVTDPTSHTSGSSTNVYLTGTFDGTNSAEMVGRSWNSNYDSCGAEFFLYDYSESGSYWVGSSYIKSGYVYQDIFVMPFHWTRTKDAFGTAL